MASRVREVTREVCTHFDRCAGLAVRRRSRGKPSGPRPATPTGRSIGHANVASRFRPQCVDGWPPSTGGCRAGRVVRGQSPSSGKELDGEKWTAEDEYRYQESLRWLEDDEAAGARADSKATRPGRY